MQKSAFEHSELNEHSYAILVFSTYASILANKVKRKVSIDSQSHVYQPTYARFNFTTGIVGFVNVDGTWKEAITSLVARYMYYVNMFMCLA